MLPVLRCQCIVAVKSRQHVPRCDWGDSLRAPWSESCRGRSHSHIHGLSELWKIRPQCIKKSYFVHCFRVDSPRVWARTSVGSLERSPSLFLKPETICRRVTQFDLFILPLEAHAEAFSLACATSAFVVMLLYLSDESRKNSHEHCEDVGTTYLRYLITE